MSSDSSPDIFNSKKDSDESHAILKNIGSQLREERVRKSIDSEELAASLNIGEEQLIALENGDKSLLPEVVFIKAMIRRVAEKLEIDSSSFINDIETDCGKKDTNQGNDNKRITKEQSSGKSITSWKIITASSVVIFITCVAIVRTTKTGILSPSKWNEDVNRNISTKSSTFIFNPVSPKKVIIRQKNGSTLFKGTLHKSKMITSNKKLEVFTGRPDLIKISINGSKSTPLGTSDDVYWHLLKIKE